MGWIAITTLAISYTVVTIACMVGLTAVSYRGLARVNWPGRSAGAVDSHWLDHYEKRITGAILITLGILIFFIKL